jgi:hypothetical protein
VPLTPPPASTGTIVREVLRIYERYAEEVVEHFDFCPWAARARRDGAVEARVLLAENHEDFSFSLAQIDALAARAHVSVGLLIYPRFSSGRLDFEHFLRRLRQADSERHPPGEIPFAMAAFHPHAEPQLDDPERLIPFIRRSPDPTIQLVRQRVLEAVRGEETAGTTVVDLWMMVPGGRTETETLGLRERISIANQRRVRDTGTAAVEAVLNDIAEDRARTYARLGLPIDPPPT